VFPVRSLTFTENDVALPAERGNLEYAGLSLLYEGNRVKSALLGRDLNPLGRGDGVHYAAGAFRMYNASTPNVGAWFKRFGTGNSVNNQHQCGGGCGGGSQQFGSQSSPDQGGSTVPHGPPTSGACKGQPNSALLEDIGDWADENPGKKPVQVPLSEPSGGDLRYLRVACGCCAVVSACCMEVVSTPDVMAPQGVRRELLPVVRCGCRENFNWCCDANDCGDTTELVLISGSSKCATLYHMNEIPRGQYLRDMDDECEKVCADFAWARFPNDIDEVSKCAADCATSCQESHWNVEDAFLYVWQDC
jgi:hypothetical protein